MFSEERLKIPINGQAGLWKIVISSGSNLDKIEFILIVLSYTTMPFIPMYLTSLSGVKYIVLVSEKSS
mgnify:CR=1 FL=1